MNDMQWQAYLQHMMAVERLLQEIKEGIEKLNTPVESVVHVRDLLTGDDDG